MCDSPILIRAAEEFTSIADDFYHPVALGGYIGFGTCSSSREGPPAPNTVFCAKPGSDPDSLCPPLGYQYVGEYNNVTIWRPIPPRGYVSLGLVATKQDGKEEPPKSHYWCVKHCYVVPGTAEHEILRGERIDAILGIEPLHPNWSGLSVGTFGLQSDATHFCLGSEHVNGTRAPSIQELHQLIGKWGPIHISHEDEEFVPTSVDWFLSRCSLTNKYTGEMQHSPEVHSLPSEEEAWAYQLKLDDSMQARRGNFNVAKAYVHAEAVDPVHTDIHFAFFYCTTGSVQPVPTPKSGGIRSEDQEANFQSITIRINNFDPIRPRFVFFSQHDQEDCIWERFEHCTQGVDGRLHVYASLCDHSLFPFPGEHQRKLRHWDELGAEVTRNGTSLTSVRSTAVLDCSKRYEIVCVDYMDSPKMAIPSWYTVLNSLTKDDADVDLNMSDVKGYVSFNCAVGPWADIPNTLVSLLDSGMCSLSSASTISSMGEPVFKGEDANWIKIKEVTTLDTELTDDMELDESAFASEERTVFRCKSAIGSIITDISAIDLTGVPGEEHYREERNPWTESNVCYQEAVRE